jgi:hypothetical protein
VLTWCIGNVVGTADRRRNLYPTKSRPDQKIDAAVALMMAMGHVNHSNATALGRCPRAPDRRHLDRENEYLHATLQLRVSEGAILKLLPGEKTFQ